MGSLTAKKSQSLVKEGGAWRYSDGNGLYLMIPRKGTPYWMLRYTLFGKRREMTLGKHAHFFAEARTKAVENQKSIREGLDPIEERKRDSQALIRTVEDLFADWYPELEKTQAPSYPKADIQKEWPPIGGDRWMLSPQLISVK